jgi:hypothetical protein
MGVGCVEAGKCYAEAQGQADRCPVHEIIPGLRESYLEEVVAYILKESMIDAKGDQTVGVATALKRVFITGFKTGQDTPKPLH